MRGWKTDVVVSLATGKGTVTVNCIREDAVLICEVKSGGRKLYFDLETGLLHGTDPVGTRDRYGVLRPAQLVDCGRAPTVIEQFVVALANPQVKADHLYQGLKASSVKLPADTKFIRNYLGGVQVYQHGIRRTLGSLIDFIMEGFDKE